MSTEPAEGNLRVRVRMFAMFRERAGCDSVELALAAGATVADALEALEARNELSDLLMRMPLRLAVNRNYADRDTVLAPGDELALIPPVSGGEGPDGRIHVRIAADPLPEAELRRRVADPQAGAIVIFHGVTRAVPRLDYEAFVEMAEERIGEIAEQCLQRHGLCRIAVEHRVGAVTLGEPSVIVAVSAAHRDEAFAGARAAIDLIKADVPIWKREHDGAGAQRWVAGHE